MKEHPGFGLFRYLADVVLSLAAAMLPRRILECVAKRIIRRDIYPPCSHILLYKSGRSALAAVFESLAKTHPDTVVLVPDYICNVIHRAAADRKLRLVNYRTDKQFHADIDDIEQKIKTESVSALLLASVFGCQNRTAGVIERVRTVDPRLLLIIDDCQNLVLKEPFYPDERTVVVFSFNMKHVPGVMGGGLCMTANPLNMPPPQRDFFKDLALEVHVLFALLRQVWNVLQRYGRTLFIRTGLFAFPELEFSDCRRLLYDTRIQRISRISLARGVFGLSVLDKIEVQRRENYDRLRKLLEGTEWGIIVGTEHADISPFVAIEGLPFCLFGRLPLKGAYARDERQSETLRPGILSYRNDGFCPVEFKIDSTE